MLTRRFQFATMSLNENSNNEPNHDLQHAFKTKLLIAQTADLLVTLSVAFTGELTDHVFFINYVRYDRATKVNINLTREQLDFLVKDPIQYGRCGNLIVEEHSSGKFIIRDEFQRSCSATDHYISDPLNLNGMIHKQLQKAAKKIKDDISLISSSIQRASSALSGTLVLNNSDLCLIKRLGLALACAIYDKKLKESNPTIRRVDPVSRIMYTDCQAWRALDIDNEMLNHFLKYSNLSVSSDVNVRKILRDGQEGEQRYNEHLIEQRRALLPSMAWSIHNYQCVDRKCISYY